MTFSQISFVCPLDPALTSLVWSGLGMFRGIVFLFVFGGCCSLFLITN